MELDGLALEYKRYYGTARGNLEISDIVNNPTAFGKCSVLSLGLPKELWDYRLVNFGALFQDRSES